MKYVNCRSCTCPGGLSFCDVAIHDSFGLTPCTFWETFIPIHMQARTLVFFFYNWLLVKIIKTPGESSIVCVARLTVDVN